MQAGGTVTHGTAKHNTEVATVAGSEYIGNNTANRAIPHGLGRTPKAVFIIGDGTGDLTILIDGHPTIVQVSVPGGWAVTAMDATNFYVGNASTYPNTANATGVTYSWAAIA